MASQSRFITYRNHPLRFLLGMEWALLLLVAIANVPTSLFWQKLFAQIAPTTIEVSINLLCLTMVFLSGLVLPIDKKSDRMIYLVGLYSIILLPSILNRLPLFQLLFIIYITRSCLICSRQWHSRGFN